MLGKRNLNDQQVLLLREVTGAYALEVRPYEIARYLKDHIEIHGRSEALSGLSDSLSKPGDSISPLAALSGRPAFD